MDETNFAQGRAECAQNADRSAGDQESVQRHFRIRAAGDVDRTGRDQRRAMLICRAEFQTYARIERDGRCFFEAPAIR